MSQNLQPSAYDRAEIRRTNTGSAPLISLVYRSRAVTVLSGYDLYELVQAAQRRNAAEAITGLLLYEEDRFYQWLEGPPDAVARVMRSITADRRHTGVELLSEKPAETRQFGDWTMRLATRGVRSIRSGQNVIVPSRETLAYISEQPEHVSETLASLSANTDSGRLSNNPLHGPAGKLLKDVVLTAVVPELVARHADKGRLAPWPIDRTAKALADMLVSPDLTPAVELIRTLQGSDGSARQFYETLIEPAARRLGDLWRADLCTEFDVTVALGQIQRILHGLNQDVLLPIIPVGMFLPSVLIVPEPGEIHCLSSVLDNDALASAGWGSENEFPETDEALQDLLADTWYDALDLSLSAAFRRQHWLPRVAKTISLARHASKNPAVVVVVGGREFAEDHQAGAQVGADGISATAMRAGKTIQAGLDRQKKG
jgi:hypothetical protein